MFDDLCSWDNLLLAYRRAARGKRGHDNVAAFEYTLEDNLLALQAELWSRTYQPGAYISFYIHEPKRRLISAALEAAGCENTLAGRVAGLGTADWTPTVLIHAGTLTPEQREHAVNEWRIDLTPPKGSA